MLKVAGGSDFLVAANESMTTAEQDQVSLGPGPAARRRTRGPTPSMTAAPTLLAPTLTLTLTLAPTLLPARPCPPLRP